MVITTVNIMLLASRGTNLVIDAETKSTAELINIAGAVGIAEGHLTIKNCNKKQYADLLSIKTVYPKNITFDFTEIKV
jgi:hypothetical protein